MNARQGTRRGLLAGGACVVAGMAAMATSAGVAVPGGAGDGQADCALIAACEAFCTLERRIEALFAETAAYGNAPGWLENERATIARQEPLRDQQDELLAEILDMHASTIEGVKARARMMKVYDGDLLHADRLDGHSELMAWALIRDLAEL